MEKESVNRRINRTYPRKSRNTLLSTQERRLIPDERAQISPSGIVPDTCLNSTPEPHRPGHHFHQGPTGTSEQGSPQLPPPCHPRPPCQLHKDSFLPEKKIIYFLFRRTFFFPSKKLTSQSGLFGLSLDERVCHFVPHKPDSSQSSTDATSRLTRDKNEKELFSRGESTRKVTT